MNIKEILSAVHTGELMGLNQAKLLLNDCVVVHDGKNLIDFKLFISSIDKLEKLLISRIQST